MVGHPTSGSPPRSRVKHPSSGFPPYLRVQHPSSGSPPCSRPISTHGVPPPLLIGALIALSRHERHSQKANPRHTALLSPPGNPALALCGQFTTIQPSGHYAGTAHSLCGEASVIPNTVSPATILTPHQAPRKGMGAPSKCVRPLTGRMTGVAP